MKQMEIFDQRLQSRPSKLHVGGAASGMNVLFEKASNLFAKNLEFWLSLVVSLLKAAITKETSGPNAKTDLQVLNCVCLGGTYNTNIAQIVLANLGRPGACWVRRIIDGGENGAKIVMRMKQVIDRRKKSDMSTVFRLVSDIIMLILKYDRFRMYRHPKKY